MLSTLGFIFVVMVVTGLICLSIRFGWRHFKGCLKFFLVLILVFLVLGFIVSGLLTALGVILLGILMIVVAIWWIKTFIL